MCDRDMSSPVRWWGDLEQLDGSTFTTSDPASNLYLPFSLYSDVSDPDFSANTSPNDVALLTGDYFLLPVPGMEDTILPSGALPESSLDMPDEQLASNLTALPTTEPAQSSHRNPPSASAKRKKGSTRDQTRQLEYSSSNSTNPKLRSAKRTAVITHGSSSTDDLNSDLRKARHNHNLVEKKYREHLNRNFEALLATLVTLSSANEDDGFDLPEQAGNLSKAAVLELACRAIRELENEKGSLAQQVEWLRGRQSEMNVNLPSPPRALSW